MVSIFSIALLAFPVAAVWVRRKKGVRALWLLTSLTVLATLVLACWAASKAGGNRLVDTYGYASTLGSMMRLALATTLLPVLAATAVAATTKVGTHPLTAYCLTVLVMTLATVAGVAFTAYTLT
jgi:hypothetical protein